jgi:single-strand DNA-binding protein
MHHGNLVVLRGHISSPPRQRELPSGCVLLTLEVTTRPPAASVPVVWFDPPRRCGVDSETPVDTEVVVVGHVRRRFFRVGGATQSRTEVVADTVCPTRRVRQVERAVATALDAIGAITGDSGDGYDRRHEQHPQ